MLLFIIDKETIEFATCVRHLLYLMMIMLPSCLWSSRININTEGDGTATSTFVVTFQFDFDLRIKWNLLLLKDFHLLLASVCSIEKLTEVTSVQLFGYSDQSSSFIMRDSLVKYSLFVMGILYFFLSNVQLASE